MPTAIATWYGPGLYGRRTACGVVLRRATIGVAHRRLPCGTEVVFYYRGIFQRVPVIDRGPYARGVSWDLTSAAARSLGLGRTARVRLVH
jgi:rare lipoprotein A